MKTSCFIFSPRLNVPNMFWELDFYFEQITQSLHTKTTQLNKNKVNFSAIFKKPSDPFGKKETTDSFWQGAKTRPLFNKFPFSLRKW